MSMIIAIEAGATRSVAALYDAETRERIREVTGPAANALESGSPHVAVVLNELISQLDVKLDECDALVAAVAGAGKGDLAKRLARTLSEATGIPQVTVSNDVAPILQANIPEGPGILVISGTGSSVLARDTEGELHLVGGLGALIGDRGSAYRIGLTALEACAAAEDGTGTLTDLSAVIYQATGTSDIDDLVVWVSHASKSEIASLAQAVIACAGDQDEVAAELVADQAACLADQVSMAKHKADLPDDVPVITYGGLIIHSKIFSTVFREALVNIWPSCDVSTATIIGTDAVLTLLDSTPESAAMVSRERSHPLPATEQTGLAPKPMDAMTALEITDWMTASNEVVHDALAGARESIARAIDVAAETYAKGGRTIYLGAGTSGRLGVLDASECPPTFGVAPDTFIGLIAGGDEALRNSIEGAEDSRDQAVVDLNALDPPLSDHDFVIGITASGTTPYVLAALDHANAINAATALIACNPVPRDAAQISIVLNTGPEVLPGSTRLKAGTATKLALNQITTGAMARCGHIYDGYMVGVKAVNDKLAERTRRIAANLLDLDLEKAEVMLEAAQGDIKVALLMQRRSMTPEEARQILEETGGHLRRALEH